MLATIRGRKVRYCMRTKEVCPFSFSFYLSSPFALTYHSPANSLLFCFALLCFVLFCFSFLFLFFSFIFLFAFSILWFLFSLPSVGPSSWHLLTPKRKSYFFFWFSFLVLFFLFFFFYIHFFLFVFFFFKKLKKKYELNKKGEGLKGWR